MCVLGVGEQEEGQETPSHPSPNFPFLQFLLDTLTGSQGFPISYRTWPGAAGGWDRRKRWLLFIQGEEVGGPHPTHYNARGHPFPIRRKRPEEVEIWAKVTAGKGLSVLGSPSFQGANGLGSESPDKPYLTGRHTPRVPSLAFILWYTYLFTHTQ